MASTRRECAPRSGANQASSRLRLPNDADQPSAVCTAPPDSLLVCVCRFSPSSRGLQIPRLAEVRCFSADQRLAEFQGDAERRLVSVPGAHAARHDADEHERWIVRAAGEEDGLGQLPESLRLLRIDDQLGIAGDGNEYFALDVRKAKIHLGALAQFPDLWAFAGREEPDRPVFINLHRLQGTTRKTAVQRVR